MIISFEFVQMCAVFNITCTHSTLILSQVVCMKIFVLEAPTFYEFHVVVNVTKLFLIAHNNVQRQILSKYI